MRFQIIRFWFLRFRYAHACAAVEALLRSLAETHLALAELKQTRDELGRELDAAEADLEIARQE